MAPKSPQSGAGRGAEDMLDSITMKPEHKAFAISLGIGVLLWVIDAWLNYAIMHNGGGLGVLITELATQDIMSRTIVLLSFIGFGFVLARMVARHRALVDELNVTREELASLRSDLPTETTE
jgi:hypothetical protein